VDLCRPHNTAFREAGGGSVDAWLARGVNELRHHRDARASLGLFEVARCGHPGIRDELAYGLLRRGERDRQTSPNVVNALALAIAKTPRLSTLLDLRYDSEGIDAVIDRCANGYRDVARAFLLDTLDQLCLLANVEPTRRYLGIASAGRGAYANLNATVNEEFRASIVRWMEYRLSSEQGAPQYVQSVVNHVQTFCNWLHGRGVSHWTDLSRAHLIDYLDHLGTARHTKGRPYSRRTRSSVVSAISVFIEEASLNEWADIPRHARWLRTERPKRGRTDPRLIGRSAARQLRSPEVLELVEDLDTRLAIQIMAETGLRRKDVCAGITIDCLIQIPGDKWSLRYLNSKSRKICIVPIQPHMARAIERHRTHKQALLPGTNHLFARDPSDRVITLTLVNRDLNRLITKLDLRDNKGNLLKVTPHMFRHQNATEWLENGMPITAIQKLLGHESLTTTEGYARLNDAKVREQWEKSFAVNSAGEVIQAPSDEIREAAWIHAFTGGAAQALPNGRCGMPCIESCEHANACLYCPLFITTPDYLPVLRQQRAEHKQMIDLAREQGYQRIVEKNEKPIQTLDKLIARLEALAPDATTAGRP